MLRMSDSIFLLFWFISVRVLSGTLTLLYMTKIIIIPEDLQMPRQTHINSHKVQIYFSLSLSQWSRISQLWDEEMKRSLRKKPMGTERWSPSVRSKRGFITLVFDLERPGSDYPSASVRQTDGTLTPENEFSDS